ncbi:unnamed protein product, partial [Laminaria digitata]
MEKGEELVQHFDRIDNIVGVLASLGVTKSEADVNRNIIMSLTSDYEIEEIAVLYRKGVPHAEVESIIRQRYLRILG